METTELTVHLPKEDLDFVEQYAREHRMTVSELIDRYLRHLRGSQQAAIHPDVERFSGIVPPDVDAEASYHEHLLKKHR